MSRHRKHEEHENHERWLVSYADFITLLFAFFVVMYAMSSVNEGKYRVLSDALIAAFRSPNKGLAPIQVGELLRSPPIKQELPVNTPQPIAVPVEVPREQQAKGGEGPERLDGQDPEAPQADREKVAGRLEESLRDLIDRGLIEVRRLEDWVEVEIKTSILFPSGTAKLVDGAIPVLKELSEILKEFPNPIQVEGFTDNVPINTEVFPSNWELSAARAASVVHVYTKHGVRPERMVALGYGEHRPAADNVTAEGRSRNRRVVIVIATGARARAPVDLRERLLEPVGASPVVAPAIAGVRADQ